MKLEAAHRLVAVMADRKQAQLFLTELGFKGLRFKSEREDEIKFFFSDYDKAVVTKFLGQPKSVEKSIRYNFGNQGIVAIWPSTDTVILQNSKRGVKLTPTPIHVPEPEPKEEPKDTGPKTGTENDDSHVPIVHITPELHAEYQMAQRNEMYRMKFMQSLWRFLNRTKFGSAMDIPNIRLMKNVKGTSLRLRGYWQASTREFAISKRLFNATQNFFVEVFLHEQCHQAVSEIDHVVDRTEKGHGPNWQRWMRKVGLNPLRFDPNENSTYMNPQEKKDYEERLARRDASLEEIKEQNLKRMPMYTKGSDSQVCTVMWSGTLYDGIAICPAVQTGAKWAFMSFDDLNNYRSGSIQWKIVPDKSIYMPRLSETTGDKEKIAKILLAVINFYRQKKEKRRTNKLYRY
jgi:predicted SprT family Zn-dependent metalloprotease